MFELDYRSAEEIWIDVVRYFERGNLEKFNEEFDKYERACNREENIIEEFPIY